MKCKSFSISHVPENVTIFIYVGNTYFCKSDMFSDPKCEKLRVLVISFNNLDNVPKGCFSSFIFLGKLTLSHDGHLGVDNLYNACYGLHKTLIQELNATLINHRVVINRPFPKNISRLLTSHTILLILNTTIQNT